MKNILFAMLVSGMLFGCTNNQESQGQQDSDSTAIQQGGILNESEVLEVEEVEMDEEEASSEII